MRPQRAAAINVLAIALLSGPACTRSSSDNSKRIQAEYNPKTGRLQLLKYDANANGKTDTWSYMDGPRVIRIEIDKDEDGKIDRWEYYSADQKIEKAGFSRNNDGVEDAWSYSRPDGTLDRIEISTRRNGKVSRIEHYEKNVVVRAEEDADEDGRIDKWETFDGDRLTSVAFDTGHRGTPDRRLVYGADGSARIEVDRTGDGHFVAQAGPRPTSRK